MALTSSAVTLTSSAPAGSPDWWVEWLIPKLAYQAAQADANDTYFKGTQGIPVRSSRRVSEAFGRLMSIAVTNFAELIVEAVRERMIPIGFRTGAVTDPTGDADAWRLWQANSLDADCALVHRAMLSLGAAYVIVGIDPRSGDVVITPEDPRQVYAELDPVRRRLVRAAIKIYRDELAGVERLYLYLPGRVYRASRPSPASSTVGIVPVAISAGGWRWDNPDGDSLPSRRVPVVPFLNRADLFNAPQAEFEPHKPLLDRINYGVLSRLEIATLQAFRQRAVKGVPAHDELGAQIDYSDVFAADPGALWLLPETAELWESGQVDLTPVRAAVRDDVEQLAAVSRMPVHYLEPVNESAEGVEAKREGLIFIAEDRMLQTGESWEQVMSLAFDYAGDPVRAARADMEIMWADPNRRSLQEMASAASQAAAGGLTWRAIMSDIWRKTPQEIRRMEAERATDALRASLLNRPATPPQNGATAPFEQITEAMRSALDATTGGA